MFSWQSCWNKCFFDVQSQIDPNSSQQSFFFRGSIKSLVKTGKLPNNQVVNKLVIIIKNPFLTPQY